jgi:hypothetical protein
VFCWTDIYIYIYFLDYECVWICNVECLRHTMVLGLNGSAVFLEHIYVHYIFYMKLLEPTILRKLNSWPFFKINMRVT